MSKPQIIINKLPNYSDSHHTADGHFENETGEPSPPPVPEEVDGKSGFTKFMGALFSAVRAKPDVITTMPIRKLKKGSEEFIINPEDKSIKVWWLGHATVLLRINNKYIITDPMLSLYASPIKGFFKRVTPAPIDPEDLPPLSYIIYSHDHYDHLSYDTLTKLKELNPNVIIFGPLGLDRLINGWDAKYNVIPFDWRMTTTVDEITFTCFPSHHFSRRTMNDAATKLWCSWLFQYKSNNDDIISIYFGGDTALGPHFREVRDFVGRPIDLALMPVGPLNPPGMMRSVHLNLQDVKDMSDVLQAKVVIPIHYGTFPLGREVETPDLVLLRRCWTNDSLLPLITGGRADLQIDPNGDHAEKFVVQNDEEMLQPNE